MEKGEVIRLVAAFVGGGIGKTILDHLLSDWTARRTALRPKDMERIETLRKQADTILEQQLDAAVDYRSKPEVMPSADIISPDTWDVVRPALFKLGDRRLSRKWTKFERYATFFPRRYAGLAEEESDKAWRTLYRLHERVLRHLTKLERRR